MSWGFWNSWGLLRDGTGLWLERLQIETTRQRMDQAVCDLEAGTFLCDIEPDFIQIQFYLYWAPPIAYLKLMEYSRIITMEAGKRSGKPCIRGLCITVADVLGYLASGMTHQEILRDFSYLNEDDILASLAFAADRERKLETVTAA